MTWRDANKASVIAGARCLLRARDVRFIFFEFSPKNMQMLSGNDSDPLWLLDELAGLGYSLYVVQRAALAAPLTPHSKEWGLNYHVFCLECVT